MATNTIDKYNVSDVAIREACEAWDHGGSLSLGLWLSRYKPRFNVADYGALVRLVRAEMGDDTDYSREQP